MLSKRYESTEVDRKSYQNVDLPAAPSVAVHGQARDHTDEE